jgi:hypothetical protein
MVDQPSYGRDPTISTLGEQWRGVVAEQVNQGRAREEVGTKRPDQRT